MRTFPIFAVLFFLVPLIEIYLLIQVGSSIGVFPTILLVVLTAVIGAALLRQQGLSTLTRFRESSAQGQMPARALLEGIFLLLGGALLMTPGFFTDAIGFICLVPFSRQALIRFLSQRIRFQSAGVATHSQHSSQSTQQSHTLDGEYTRKDSD